MIGSDTTPYRVPKACGSFSGPTKSHVVIAISKIKHPSNIPKPTAYSISPV